MPLTNKDANDYLNELVEGKRKVEAQVEVTALGQFRFLSAQIEKLAQRAGQLTQQLQALRNDVQRLNGQREAYATILCESEAARRGLPPLEPGVEQVTKDELERRLGGKLEELPPGVKPGEEGSKAKVLKLAGKRRRGGRG